MPTGNPLIDTGKVPKEEHRLYGRIKELFMQDFSELQKQMKILAQTVLVLSNEIHALKGEVDSYQKALAAQGVNTAKEPEPDSDEPEQPPASPSPDPEA